MNYKKSCDVCGSGLNPKNRLHRSCSLACSTILELTKYRIALFVSFSNRHEIRKDAYASFSCKVCGQKPPIERFTLCSVYCSKLCKNRDAYKIGKTNGKNVQYRQKKKLHPNWKLQRRLRNRFHQAVTAKTNRSALKLLGCTINHFREHMQKQFTKAMAWNNYGKYWEIDHIQPLASFDLTDPEHVKRCFHYTNHRPLQVLANRVKGDRVIVHQPELTIFL